MRSRLSLLVLALLAAPVLRADASASADDTSQELLSLLNTPIAVASKKALTPRESPGIVSFLGREEIQNAGCRDLIDVLHLIPGFSFGVDVQGVVGVAVRGAWGHEGKVLLLVDGQEMNETLYSTLQFGNHYPVDLIKRVEVIRGPGSAMYGGYAELAVINVVTLGAEDLKGGGYASATYGAGEGGALRKNLSLAWGAAGDGWGLSLSGMAGDAVRSNRDYQDVYGNRYSLRDASSMKPLQLNLGFQAGAFSFRAVQDDYRTLERDEFANSLEKPVSLDFRSTHLEAKYDLKLGEGFTLTPRLSYATQRPWEEHGTDPADPAFDTPLIYDKKAERTTVGLQATWEPMDKAHLTFGAERTKDHAEAAAGTPDFNGVPSLDFTSSAAYVQGLFTLPWFTVTVGARSDHHSQFGNSFVPRVALTKAFERFHFKVLLARAFRAPAFENLASNAAIKPEKTRTAEVEVGFRVTSGSYLTLNAFDTRIEQPIVYFVDANGEGYANFPHTGTRGLEAEYKMAAAWGTLTLGYSTYRAKDNAVPLYAVPGQDDALLAMPKDKATLLAHLKLGRGFSVDPSVVRLGERWGYVPSATPGFSALSRAQHTVLLGCALNWKPQPKGPEASLGVQNALNRDMRFFQPYASPTTDSHMPLPTAGREIVLRGGWNF